MSPRPSEPRASGLMRALHGWRWRSEPEAYGLLCTQPSGWAWSPSDPPIAYCLHGRHGAGPTHLLRDASAQPATLTGPEYTHSAVWATLPDLPIPTAVGVPYVETILPACNTSSERTAISLQRLTWANVVCVNNAKDQASQILNDSPEKEGRAVLYLSRDVETTADAQTHRLGGSAGSSGWTLRGASMSVNRSFRILGALFAVVMVAAVVTGSPAPADEKPVESFEIPAPTPNKNNSEGASSELAEAFDDADETNKPVEVESRRDDMSTVYANPDGTLTQEVAAAPIRAKNADGDYVALDPDLAPSGGRLEPKVATQDLSFSSTGDGSTAVLATGGDHDISLTALAELGAPEVDGGTATYPVQSDENLSLRVSTTSSGFASHVLLANAPAEAPIFRFRVSAPGLDVTLKGQQLVFRDGEKVVAQSRRLQMWDADVDEAGAPEAPVDVDAELLKDGDSTILELRPSQEWLTDSERTYPVTVDPDIEMATSGDSFYFEGQDPAYPRNGDVNLRVGSDDGDRQFRSIVYFRYKRLLGLDVTDASLKLRQYSNGAVNCAARQMLIIPATDEGASAVNDKAGATWDTKPDTVNNGKWTSTTSFNKGSDCAAGDVDLDVTNMVNSWGSGQLNGDDGGLNRQAFVMTPPAASLYDTTFDKRFCSENWTSSSSFCANATVIPTLSIVVQPELGSQSWYSTTDHPFNNHSSLSVNNRNGNLVVQSKDGSMNGVGLDLDISRTYNSQATVTNTTLGKGWNLGIGPDIWLRKRGNFRFDYHGPSGTILGSFLRKSWVSTDPDYKKFITPIGGVGSELEETSTGFTLTFKKSRQKFDFKTESDGNAYLTKLRDRSDNEITFTYSGTVNGRPKLTTINDAGGHVLNVTYTGNYLTTIAESVNYTQHGSGQPRSWGYTYDTSGRLKTHTDPVGNTVTYDYNAAGQLAGINGQARTKPNGGATNTSETDITYGTSDPQAQVSTVKYRYDDGSSTAAFYTYTWTYPTALSTACQNNGDYSRTVKDPNNHVTTYCFKNRDDNGANTKYWVYDATNEKQSMEFNVDNAPATFTNASGAATANTYSGGGLQDRLTEVTEPNNNPNEKEAKSGLTYNDSNPAEGGAYLPITARSSTGDCNRYDYDSKGRVTTAYTGQASTPSGTSLANATLGSCPSTGSTSEDKFERRYNNNGTVSESWDANAPSTPAQDDKTLYTYWASGDTGFVAGSGGQVKSVRKPGGDCSTGSARKLCTSYTYDGAARVKSMIDGRGKATTYDYDRNDQVLKVSFNTNDAACLINAGYCISYTYDNEQNLIKREVTGSSRTTTLYYDRMNRLVAQLVAVDANNNDFVTSAYDGAGNLTYRQNYLYGAPADHVAQYSYDAANRPTGINDNGDIITIDTDSDGRRQSMKFPAATGTDGAKLSYDYTSSGRPKTLTWATHAGTEKAKVTYNYSRKVTVGAFVFYVDTPQLQTRTVTGSGASSNQTGVTTYTYAKKRMTKAVDGNGTDYDYTYDKIGNITKEVATGATTDTTYYGYSMAGMLCWSGPNNGTTNINRNCPAAPTGDTTMINDAAGNSLGTSADPIVVNDANQVSNIDGVNQSYLDQGNDLRRENATNRELDAGLGITGIKRGSTYEYYLRDSTGAIVASHAGSTSTYFASEPNGNVLWLFNNAGARVGAYKYAPYGSTTSTGSVADSNRFRWLSTQQNSTSSGSDGAYKLGARYYDGSGHFTQPDPVAGGLSDPRTLTGYNYAGGDPINQADPTGMSFLGINWGSAARVGLDYLGAGAKRLAKGLVPGLSGLGVVCLTYQSAIDTDDSFSDSFADLWQCTDTFGWTKNFDE